MFSVESLYAVMILMNLLVGGLLLVSFWGKQDESSRLWAYASFSLSIGLGLILAGAWVHPVWRYAGANFAALFPFFLYVKSIKCLTEKKSGNLWFGVCISLLFSLAVYALVNTRNSWFVPLFASFIFGMAYFWSAWELSQLAQKVQNPYIRLMTYLLGIGGVAWLIRALLSKAFSFEFAPDPVFANWVILILITVVVLLRHIAYLLIRFGSAEKEKQMITVLNAELNQTIEQKNILIKTLSTSVKATHVGGVVAGIVHELSQPLGAIGLNTQILIKSASLPVDARRDTTILHNILHDNRRASSIIGRLRNFYQKGPKDHAEVRLSEMVEGVLELVAPMCTQQNILTQTQIDPGLRVWGDQGELEMVVVNVLTNAINALSQMTSPAEIITTLNVRDDRVIVDIQNNGPVIPGTRQSEIFNLFHSTKSQGLGVGLWLSREIMENHGGSIELLRSSSEDNTCFRLSLPKLSLTHVTH